MLSYLALGAAQAWAMATPPQSGEGGAAQQGGGAQFFIFIIGFIVIFYFLMLRPQKKQQRERQNMLDNIQKGDRIQTTGGLIGQVTATDQKELTVLIAPEVRVKIARGSVAAVVKSGSDSSSLSKG
jgi:preprotein translocase subunit YajC